MYGARKAAEHFGLEMKISDVEYQGDKSKATFFYTANGRVDFRELIKKLSSEFKVRVEMRQIGARQEASQTGWNRRLRKRAMLLLLANRL